MRRALLARLSYANTVATLALFLALGGTSYAVLHVSSRDVVDNSLRSKDIHDHTIRARDVARNALGARVIRESTLRTVPRAADADRIGGLSAQDLRLRCPPETVSKAGVCVELSARDPVGFTAAVQQCSQAGRALATMPQLDPFARTSGPLASPEWTASVYRNPANGTPAEQLEAILLSGVGDVGYERVNFPVQHAFRCVALPSN